MKRLSIRLISLDHVYPGKMLLTKNVVNIDEESHESELLVCILQWFGLK